MAAVRLNRVGIRILLIVCVGFFIATIGAAQAGVTIIAPTINLPHSAAEQTGSFEVYVVSDLDPQLEVGAQNTYLQLPIQSDVTFTDVDIPVDHPYIFGGTIAGDQLIDPNTASVTDFTLDTPPTLTGDPGWGLLLVKYSVAPNVSGSFPLTFDVDLDNNPLATALFEPTGKPIEFTIVPGAINVATPEPSTLILGLAGLLGLAAFRRRFR